MIILALEEMLLKSYDYFHRNKTEIRKFMSKYKTLDELIKDYPDKNAREEELKAMSDEDIDTLISHMNNIQGKIYLKSFKKDQR